MYLFIIISSHCVRKLYCRSFYLETCCLATSVSLLPMTNEAPDEQELIEDSETVVFLLHHGNIWPAHCSELRLLKH